MFAKNSMTKELEQATITLNGCVQTTDVKQTHAHPNGQLNHDKTVGKKQPSIELANNEIDPVAATTGSAHASTY